MKVTADVAVVSLRENNQTSKFYILQFWLEEEVFYQHIILMLILNYFLPLTAVFFFLSLKQELTNLN